MLIYILIFLSLSLAGIAGIQFFYLMYMDKIRKHHKNRVRLLEGRCKHLNSRLKDAETQLLEQRAITESIEERIEEEDEIWADVIED